jgi:hypothetical protein
MKHGKKNRVRYLPEAISEITQKSLVMKMGPGGHGAF